MAQDQNSSDDEWMEMQDCQVCHRAGNTCGRNCKNIVSLIVNNATTLFANDDEDTSHLSVTEKLQRMEQMLKEDATHQQYREHDISGVCANVTSVLPEANEQEPDDFPDNPPQDDQFNNAGNPPQDDQNIPGVEELIALAELQINDAGDEPPELLQSMLQQYSFDASDFQNDDDKAIYIINSLHCVYYGATRPHLRNTEAEVMKRMNYLRQFIQARIGLGIPENITSILYKVFSNSDKDDEDDDDSVENVETFDLLGPHFGRAYRVLIGENIDEEDDDDNDETANLADGNSDVVVVDDDDSEYYSDAEDTSGSWEGGDDDWVDSAEEEVENERRCVRSRQN